MAWKRSFVVAAIACSAVAVACGLEHVGTADTVDTGDDAGDAGASLDAGGKVTAADTGPTCVAALQITDALTTIDGTRWQIVKDSSNGDHPKAVTGGESPLAGTVVSLVTPMAGNSRGGLWLQAPVPTRAFDVKLSVYVACGGTCGDGLAFVWADTTDRTLLDMAASGRALGVPPKADGGALLLDLHQNAETADPPTPNLEIIQIDGTKAPGSYAWIKGNTPKTDMLLAKEHTLGLRLRKGTLEVQVDGVIATSAPTSAGFSAIFGVTASTGADTALFLIRDFSGTFYDCDP